MTKPKNDDKVSWRSQGQGPYWSTKWGTVLGILSKGKSIYTIVSKDSKLVCGETAKVDRIIVSVTKKKNNAGKVIEFDTPRIYSPYIWQKFEIE